MAEEKTFYDRDGRAVAFTDDGVHVFLLSGQAVAYFVGDSVYSYTGAHLGWHERGWMRDAAGDCVLFTDGISADGPVRPEKQGRPARGIKAERPAKGNPEIRPTRALNSRAWSSASVAEFFQAGPPPSASSLPEEEDEH